VDGSVSVFAAGRAARTEAARAPAPANGAAQAAAEAAAARRAAGIRLSGSAAEHPAPLASFADLGPRFGAPPRLLARLAAQGWAAPTAVQRQAIPSLLGGAELLAVAPTGSGKTLAFLLPILLSLRGPGAARPDAPPGPRALLVAPTRELAAQTQRVFARLLRPGARQPRCAVLTRAGAGGGVCAACDVLVGTPARLAAALAASTAGARLSLDRCAWLVLDEADKLFDFDFLSSIDALLAAAAAAAAAGAPMQRALFSATLPERVEALARSLLTAPVRLTVGPRGGASAAVKQRLLFCGSEAGKLLAMRQMLCDGGLRPPALVFVQSGERAQQLAHELRASGLPIRAMHGGLSSAQRAAALSAFRAGQLWLLICTDVLARGLDFVGVHSVINYDFPHTATAYVHRVGRSGRGPAGSGQAVTLFTEADAPKLRAIAHLVAAAGGEAPAWMLRLPKAGGGAVAAAVPRRAPIESASKYDRVQARKKRSMVEASQRQAAEAATG